MKRVINIPERIYNGLKSNEKIIRTIRSKYGGSIGLQAQLTILDGTPLEDELTKELHKVELKILEANGV